MVYTCAYVLEIVEIDPTMVIYVLCVEPNLSRASNTYITSYIHTQHNKLKDTR